MCRECSQLRQQYAKATAKRQWAKADLIAAMTSHDANAISVAESAKAEAVRNWEWARAELEAHVNAHNR